MGLDGREENSDKPDESDILMAPFSVGPSNLAPCNVSSEGSVVVVKRFGCGGGWGVKVE